MIRDWAGLAIDVEAIKDQALSDAEIDKLGQGLIELLELKLPLGSAYRFEPQGVSLVRFGDHGRIAIHSWPEQGKATIDLWLQRPLIDKARVHLEHFLAAEHSAQITAVYAVGAR